MDKLFSIPKSAISSAGEMMILRFYLGRHLEIIENRIEKLEKEHQELRQRLEEIIKSSQESG